MDGVCNDVDNIKHEYVSASPFWSGDETPTGVLRQTLNKDSLKEIARLVR